MHANLARAADPSATNVIELAPSMPMTDETARLKALESLLILDSPAEDTYDELVALASEVCGTPIALVSLVDCSRQWFKAKVGLEARETHRDLAFCAYAIGQPQALCIVEDALLDARFVNNPLVIGEPFVRFYAGAPIVTREGHALGTLCVIDTRPRKLTAGQERSLRFLAKQAAVAMDLRRHSLEVTRHAIAQASLTADARLKQEKGAELLDLVLQSQDLGLWDLDVKAGVWTTNAREQSMLGYSAGEAGGKGLNLEKLIPAEDWPLIKQSMQAHLRGDAPFYECTHRMRHRNGHWIWILNRAIVVKRDETGKPSRIVGTHLDVTVQRRIDAAYAVEVGRRKVLLEQAHEFIFVLNRAVRVTEVNASFATALGYSAEELMTLHPWHWDANYPTKETFAARFATWPTQPWRTETRWRRKDGSIFEVEISCTPVTCNGEGELMMVCRDITEAKQNRTALEAARKMLEQTAALARVGGWEVDLVTSKLTWSREVYRIHAIDESWQPNVQEALAFYAAEARPIMTEAVREAIAHGTSFDLELPLITAGGRRTWVRSIGRTEFEKGRAVRLVGAFQDITERRNAQEALIHSEQRLTLALESSRQSIFDWDIERDHVHLSPQMAVSRGGDARPMDLTLDSFIALIHPDDRESLKRMLQAAAEGNMNSYEHEHRISKLGGGWIWVRSVGRVSRRLAGGSASRLSAVDEEVTARKAAEQALVESERRLRTITDNLPAMISHVDCQERYTFVNAHLARVYRQPREKLIGKSLRKVRSDKSYADGAAHVAAVMQGHRAHFEAEACVNGRHLFYQSHYVPDVAADGRINGFFALTFDVTDQKRAELKLAESERRLRGLADNVPALFSEVGTDGCFRFANANYGRWLGVDVQTMVGQPVAKALGQHYSQDRMAEVNRALAGEHVVFEREVALPTGLRTLHSTYVPHFDAQHRVAGFYALTSDITDMKNTQRQLEVLARVDPLTGIGNRRQCDERLPQALARAKRSKKAGALFYIDVDRFKSINDLLGHASGDDVLKEFALRIRDCVRETDFVARYAGDEFVAIIENVGDEAKAQKLAEKIIDTVRPSMTLDAACVFVTASIGIAIFDGDERLPEVLARADAALYSVKERGRDGFAVANVCT